MLVSSLFALAASQCAVEHARYALRHDPALTARFVAVDSGPDWPARLALRLHSTRSGHDHWFLPADGGSDGRQALVSIADPTRPGWRPPSPDGGGRPLGEAEDLGAEAADDLLDGVPRRGTPAPAHFLVPDLRQPLWYRAPAQRREPSARQFFDRVRCDD